jgi:hypothetical protein
VTALFEKSHALINTDGISLINGNMVFPTPQPTSSNVLPSSTASDINLKRKNIQSEVVIINLGVGREVFFQILPSLVMSKL